MGTFYILDDTFQISEEVQNMSEEEMHKQAKILEEEGRRERKKIKKRKTLLGISRNVTQPVIVLSLAKNPAIPRAVGIFFVWAAHLLKSIFRKWNNGKILHTDSMLAFPLFPKPILPARAWDQVNLSLLPSPVLPIS